MHSTQGVGETIPHVSDILCFKTLYKNKVTSYSHMLDHQLCEYLGLGDTLEIKEDRHVKILEKMLSINFYSISSKYFKINNLYTTKENQFKCKKNIDCFIPLEVKRSKHTGLVTITTEGCADNKLQYRRSDLILSLENTYLEFDRGSFLCFNLEECSETEWRETIDSGSFCVKPTR